MSVNTEEPVLPPELRHDGAGSRAVDVIVAIMAAHRAGAFVASVTTSQHRDSDGRITSDALTVHMQEPGGARNPARSEQALTVMSEFGISRSQIASLPLPDDVWAYQGTTDDGLAVTVFAGGPVAELGGRS